MMRQLMNTIQWIFLCFMSFFRKFSESWKSLELSIACAFAIVIYICHWSLMSIPTNAREINQINIYELLLFLILMKCDICFCRKYSILSSVIETMVKRLWKSIHSFALEKLNANFGMNFKGTHMTNEQTQVKERMRKSERGKRSSSGNILHDNYCNDIKHNTRCEHTLWPLWYAMYNVDEFSLCVCAVFS